MLVKTQGAPPAAKPTAKRSLEEGYGTLGEFLADIVRCRRSSDTVISERFDTAVAANMAGLGEALPSEGGFLVQSDLAQDLAWRVYQTGLIAQRCQRISLRKPGG